MYWIGVVSKEHVMRGVELGIAQLGHGKRAPLARMHRGDWLIYYSPKIALDGKELYQCFTAIGEVADDDIVQVKISDTFQPFRRKVDYKPSKDVSILPLIPELSFIKDKKRWGYGFRFGLIEIPKSDFDIIASAMLQ